MPLIYTDLVKKTYNFKALNNQFSLNIGDVLKSREIKVNQVSATDPDSSCTAACSGIMLKEDLMHNLSRNDSVDEIVKIDAHTCDKNFANCNSRINNKFQSQILSNDVKEDGDSDCSEIQMVATINPDTTKASKTAKTKMTTRLRKLLANKEKEVDMKSLDSQEDINRKLQDLLKKTGAILNHSSKPDLNISLTKVDGDEDIQFQEIETVLLMVRYMGNNNKIHRINLKVNDRLEILIAKMCELEDLTDDQTQNLPSLSAACDMLKLQYKGEDLSFFATAEQLKLRSGSLIECLRKRAQQPPSHVKLTNMNAISSTVTTTIKLRIQYNDALVRAAQVDDSQIVSTVALKVGFYEICAQACQPLTEISQKFCSDLGLNPNKITFEFDGDLLPISKTIVDLGLENEDTIDAILKT